MSDLEKLSPERLAEIAARVEAATPGRWEAYQDRVPGEPPFAGVYADYNVYSTEHGNKDSGYEHGRAIRDSRFIAASRTDVPALLAHIKAVEAELQFAKDEWAGLQEAHERLKASYVANPQHWRSRCEMLEAEVERLRKGAMQHAKDWMESAAEALAQENENIALRAERDALAAKIARVTALPTRFYDVRDSDTHEPTGVLARFVFRDDLDAVLRDEEAAK